MSKTLAKVEEHLEDLHTKERIRTLQERFDSIIESTTSDEEGKKIKLVAWEEWAYKNEDRELHYVLDDLEGKTDRELIGKCLSLLAEALYFDMPDLDFLSDEDKTDPNMLVKYFTLANTIEAIRLEEIMMGWYWWTYDSFRYKFLKQDASIDPGMVRMLPKGFQYLYALERQFWWEPPISTDPQVTEALIKTEDMLREIYEQDSSLASMEMTYEKIFPIYKELSEDDQEDESKGGGWSWGWGSWATGGWLPKSVQDILGDSNNLDLEKLLEEMRNLSEQKMKNAQETGEGSEANFGRDIDKEFDEKERAEEGNSSIGKYGRDDPVLNISNGLGHEEPTLAKNDYMSYEQLYKEIYPYISVFARKLSSIMKDNRYNRFWWAYRTWKLNNKKYYRRKAGSDKVFSRKIHRRHKDYAVTLLIDESGSMCSNEKNRNAAKATALFSEVLHKVGINFEIRAFNASDRCYKTFYETFSSKHRRNIERIILNSHGSDAGCNNDGFAVNKASFYLNKHWEPGTERILIVLSDGLPAPSYGTVPKWDQKRLPTSQHQYCNFDLHTEIAKASSNAVVIWVGIWAHHVRDYYIDNAICDEVRQLPEIVLNKLKRKIKRW